MTSFVSFPCIRITIQPTGGDPTKPEALNRGESYIRHIDPERVAANYTGTTREEIVPRLEAKGLKCGNRVVPGIN